MNSKGSFPFIQVVLALLCVFEIRSGDLLFTVVTNPETLGKQAVGEVLRYLQYHVVNFSTNVSLEVLDQDNIGQLEDVYKSEEADDEKTALP